MADVTTETAKDSKKTPVSLLSKEEVIAYIKTIESIRDRGTAEKPGGYPYGVSERDKINRQIAELKEKWKIE